jgi:uncharacterized protein YjbI with pentapeptide repeats
LAHLELKDQTRFFKTVTPGVDLDLRGTELSWPLLEKLFRAAVGPDGRATFGEANLEQAQIVGVQFRGVVFRGRADFSGARFQCVIFEWTRFLGAAVFDDTIFDDLVIFRQGLFGGTLKFQDALFKGDLIFDGGEIQGGLIFEESKTFGEAAFIGLEVKGSVALEGLECAGLVEFSDVDIDGDLSLQDTAFSDRLVFDHVSVKGTTRLSGAKLNRDLDLNLTSVTEYALDGASFRGRVAGNFNESLVDFTGANFEEGFAISLINSQLNLERVYTGKPSMLAADFVSTLSSVRETAVDDLLIVDVDLSDCSFLGAHRLDKLRLEGTCTFGTYRKRQVLAEERAWRADRDAPVGPRRIADLYRQLRKAQEDSKNEPGAADFYFGEMEMRRHSSVTPWSERVILHLYWLVSGYGLRALRALATLAILIAVVSSSIWLGGFKTTPAFGDTLIYVAQSTVSLETKLTSLPKDLTPFGEVMRLVMRVLGPLLLGLTLLAVRNRVKR